jgi:VanZ family protein
MAAMAWGLAIEVAQIFVPRHGWEWVDLGWNGVGGLAGAILCVALPVRSLAVGRS